MSSPIVNVSVEKAAGTNLLNLSEWNKMPFPERVALLKDGKATFLDDTGDIVPPVEALQRIKEDAQNVSDAIV